MGRRPIMWKLITNRQRFGVFLLGAALSNVGTWCQNIAAIILVYRLTEDTAFVALVSVVQFAGGMFLGPYAGVVADRFDRRWILALCQIGGVAASIALAVLDFAGLSAVWTTLLCMGVLGVFQALQAPAQLALTPSLVEPDQRDLGLSLNATQFNIARAVGPAVASGIILVSSVGWAFAYNAVSYAAFLVALLAVRPYPQRRPATRPTLRGTVIVLRRSRLVAVLLVIGLVVFGSTDVIVTLGPAISTEVTGTDAWAGAFVSAFGLGAVLMAVFLIPALRRIRFLIAPLLALQSLALAVFAWAPSEWVSLAAAFVCGATFLGAANRALTLIQDAVDPEVLGRITAIWVMAVVGGRVLFAALEGWWATLVSARSAGYIVAFIVLVTTAWFWFMRHRTPPTPPPPLPSIAPAGE